MSPTWLCIRRVWLYRLWLLLGSACLFNVLVHGGGAYGTVCLTNVQHIALVSVGETDRLRTIAKSSIHLQRSKSKSGTSKSA